MFYDIEGKFWIIGWIKKFVLLKLKIYYRVGYILFNIYIVNFLKKKNNKGMYVKKWNKLNLRCFIFFYSIEKIS